MDSTVPQDYESGEMDSRQESKKEPESSFTDGYRSDNRMNTTVNPLYNSKGRGGKELLKKQNADLQKQLKEKECEEVHEKYISVLKNNIEEQQDTIENLKTSLYQKGELLKEARLRLGAWASAASKAGNNQTEDMSTPNRSAELASRYESLLYHHFWTIAFEELREKHKIKETDALKILCSIFVGAFKIAQDVAKKQRSSMEKILVNLINISFVPCQEEVFQRRLQNAVVAEENHRGTNHPLVQAVLDYIKLKQCSLALEELGALQEMFDERFPTEFNSTVDLVSGQTESQILNLLDEEKIKTFKKNCIEIAWFMSVQIPPMHIEYLRDGPVPFDKNVHRVYDGEGPHAIQCVWPTLYYSEGGDVAVKGSYVLGEIGTTV